MSVQIFLWLEDLRDSLLRDALRAFLAGEIDKLMLDEFRGRALLASELVALQWRDVTALVFRGRHTTTGEEGLMLQGRILRTGDQREYVESTFDGTNHSGITPLDNKVLVRMDEHAEVSSGGIVIPEDTRSRQSMASETGVIIALGAMAFRLADDGDRLWTTKSPSPGDRVVVERYAGRVVQGKDGVEYRLVSQMSIGALFGD